MTTNELTLDHPSFPAFFREVLVEECSMTPKELAYAVGKIWKWQPEFDEWIQSRAEGKVVER